MEVMKKILVVPTLALISVLFVQCSSAQLDKKIPVTVTDSYYQNWVGGQPGSRGTIVSIKLSNPNPKMVFDSIYFNNKAAKLKSNLVKKQLTLTGNFVAKPRLNNVIMHGDSKKEFGNSTIKRAVKSQFELEKNEAVISYIFKNERRYFKLVNIKKTKTLFYQ